MIYVILLYRIYVIEIHFISYDLEKFWHANSDRIPLGKGKIAIDVGRCTLIGTNMFK